MHTLKRFVRSARNPVVQAANRITEHVSFRSFSDSSLSSTHALSNYWCHSPNNYCILDDGRCCEVVSIDADHVTRIVYSEEEPLYMRPCDSRALGIYKVRLRSGKMKYLNGETLACKAMCHRNYSKECLVFIKLLHHV